MSGVMRPESWNDGKKATQYLTRIGSGLESGRLTTTPQWELIKKAGCTLWIFQGKGHALVIGGVAVYIENAYLRQAFMLVKEIFCFFQGI